MFMIAFIFTGEGSTDRMVSQVCWTRVLRLRIMRAVGCPDYALTAAGEAIRDIFEPTLGALARSLSR
jgi:hypothetical protein